MREIVIPETVQEYKDDLLERALPEPLITENDFYRRLIDWVVDRRTPLLYLQDHPDEYTNFSINFNWLLLRDYQNTELGPPDTIMAMYGLHELTHMTYRLPTRLDDITAEEYAEDFTRSEYRASNETEILIHYRIPELREMVFSGMKIGFDILKARGVPQPSSHVLGLVRPLAVETDVLRPLIADDPDAEAVLNRLQQYNGNRQWATERFESIKPHFQCEFSQARGLTDTEYERVIAAYEPQITQEIYEQHVIRNVRLGYAMCGLEVPLIGSFKQAAEKAKELEGNHAVVQS